MSDKDTPIELVAFRIEKHLETSTKLLAEIAQAVRSLARAVRDEKDGAK